MTAEEVRDETEAPCGRTLDDYETMLSHQDRCIDCTDVRLGNALTALSAVERIAEDLIKIREFISNGHRVSDYGHDLMVALGNPDLRERVCSVCSKPWPCFWANQTTGPPYFTHSAEFKR